VRRVADNEKTVDETGVELLNLLPRTFVEVFEIAVSAKQTSVVK
jgi:hypothetical protein